MVKEVYVQVGVTALRSPLGDFLPAVPLFIKEKELKQSGLSQAEEDACHSVAGVVAEIYDKAKSKK